MPRKSKKKVTFLEKPEISGKRRGYSGCHCLPPLLPMLALPPSRTPHPAQPPKQTTHSNVPPKQTTHSNLPPKQTTHSNLPPKLILNSSWHLAPPPGGRQLLEVNQPVVDSSCLTPCAAPRKQHILWQHHSGVEEIRIPAAGKITTVTNAGNAHGLRRPVLQPSHTDANQSAVSGEGLAQMKDLVLLQSGDSKKAKKEAEEPHRKVLYLIRQYDERVRDMEELLQAVQSEREEAERETQEVEQKNSELRSINAELHNLIVRLQTCADLGCPAT